MGSGRQEVKLSQEAGGLQFHWLRRPVALGKSQRCGPSPPDVTQHALFLVIPGGALSGSCWTGKAGDVCGLSELAAFFAFLRSAVLCLFWNFYTELVPQKMTTRLSFPF